MPFHFPGHNYLGPGSDLKSGKQPVDEDDQIALLHDRLYEQSTSEEEIRKADLDTIKRFGKSALQGNWHSGIGAVGLGSKYLLESLTGVLYPKMPPSGAKRRKNDETAIENSASDFAESSETMGEEVSIREPQTGGSTPGGTGSSVIATIIKNPSVETVRWCYRKTFQIYTGGLQFSRQPASASTQWASLFQEGTKLITTPLAVIDPNLILWYVDPAQWNQMPVYTIAHTARIKLTPVGIRLPFATNEGASTYANSQTLVQCCYAVGINSMHNITYGPYVFDPSDSTLVSGFGTTFGWAEMLYGLDGSIGCCMGVPRHLNNYMSLLQSSETFYSVNGLDLYEVRNVLDCKGVPIINFKYDFKNGILQIPSANPIIMQRSIQKAPIPCGVQPSTFTDLINDETKPYTGERSWSTYSCSSTNSNNNLPKFGYFSPIDKAPYMVNQIDQPQTPDCPPLVTFGCMPVQSNPVNASTATFTAACIIWQVETELEVSLNTKFVNPGEQVCFLKQFDPIWAKKDFTLGPVSLNNPQAFISNRRLVTSDNPYDTAPIGPVTVPTARRLFK